MARYGNRPTRDPLICPDDTVVELPSRMCPDLRPTDENESIDTPVEESDAKVYSTRKVQVSFLY